MATAYRLTIHNPDGTTETRMATADQIANWLIEVGEAKTITVEEVL